MPRERKSFSRGGPSVSSTRLILASGSATRAALLRGARTAFGVVQPGVDEDALKARGLAAGRTPAQIAMILAEAKCAAVSAAHFDALVIGADQVLDLDGRILSKPGGIGAAKDQLRALSGKTHVLWSAICVARGGAPQWRHLGEARMTMRELPDAEIARYAAAAGGAILRSVGAYQYEGLGANLFCAAEGDYSTILGLPLLPLLGFLRFQGISFS